MKKIILLYILLLSMNRGNTQPVNPGEKVPDIEAFQLMNYSKPTLKVSDFRGKLLILNFWSPGCGTCLSSFPVIDKLQKEFAGSVQFIFITRVSKKVVEDYFARNHKLKMPAIPFVTGDTVFQKYFPYRTVPHHVWIDPEGKLASISYVYNTSPANIKKFLASNKIELTQKKDVFDYDYSKPMIIEGNGRWFNNLQYYSYLMRPPRGINASVKTQPGHIIVSAASVKQLFVHAYNEGQRSKFTDRNTLLETKDTFKYDYPPISDRYDEWINQYRYHYELKVPEERASEAFSMMKKDLERYFPIQAKIETRNLKSFVLTRIPGEDKLKAIEGRKVNHNLYNSNQEEYFGQNLPYRTFVSVLAAKLREHMGDLPFIDETGFREPVDFVLKGALLDDPRKFQALQNELKKYGLLLEVKIAPVEVLALKDAK